MAVNSSGPGMFIIVSLLVIHLFKLFIVSSFKLGRSYVSRYLFISSRFSNWPTYNFSKDSLMILLISFVSVVMSPFSNFIYLGLFLLASLAQSLSILSLQKTNSVSLMFRIILLDSISFNSPLTFIIFFYLLIWGLVCSCLSKAMRCIIRLFISETSIMKIIKH